MLHRFHAHRVICASCLPFLATLGIVLASVISPVLSVANIYRCVNKDGVVVYSDRPCDADAVVAFKESRMSVDDAINRDVIYVTALRDRLSLFEPEVEAHAKIIGNCILPDQMLNEIKMNHIGKNAYNKDWNWTVVLFYGLDIDDREWQIDILYKARMDGKRASIRVAMIRIYKNDRLMDPPAMDGVRTLRKTKTGEWR